MTFTWSATRWFNKLCVDCLLFEYFEFHCESIHIVCWSPPRCREKYSINLGHFFSFEKQHISKLGNEKNEWWNLILQFVCRIFFYMKFNPIEISWMRLSATKLYNQDLDFRFIIECKLESTCKWINCSQAFFCYFLSRIASSLHPTLQLSHVTFRMAKQCQGIWHSNGQRSQRTLYA